MVNAIMVIHRFGGRRCPPPIIPPMCKNWNTWDCDPEKQGRPTLKHAYGKEFPWTFDYTEKAYILEGEATMTADNPHIHGPPVVIKTGDMVTFPKGWRGKWTVHTFLKKVYAFFDDEGLQVDESSDSEESGEEGEYEEGDDVKPEAGGVGDPGFMAAAGQPFPGGMPQQAFGAPQSFPMGVSGQGFPSGFAGHNFGFQMPGMQGMQAMQGFPGGMPQGFPGGVSQVQAYPASQAYAQMPQGYQSAAASQAFLGGVPQGMAQGFPGGVPQASQVPQMPAMSQMSPQGFSAAPAPVSAQAFGGMDPAAAQGFPALAQGFPADAGLGEAKRKAVDEPVLSAAAASAPAYALAPGGMEQGGGVPLSGQPADGNPAAAKRPKTEAEPQPTGQVDTAVNPSTGGGF